MTVNAVYGKVVDHATAVIELPEDISEHLPSPNPEFQHNQSLICFAQADEFSVFFSENGVIEHVSSFYFERYPAYQQCLQILRFNGDSSFDLLAEKEISSATCGVEHVSEQPRLRSRTVFSLAELRDAITCVHGVDGSFVVRLLLLTVQSLDSEFSVNFTLNFYLLNRLQISRMQDAVENCFRLLKQRRCFVGYNTHVATSFLENYLNRENRVLNLCQNSPNSLLELDELPPMRLMGKKEQLTRQLAKNRKLQEEILEVRAELEALERVSITGDPETKQLVLKMAARGLTPEQIAASIDVGSALLPAQQLTSAAK